MDNKIIINVCASQNSFGAYATNCEGIYASGDTIEDCKKDIQTAIQLIKKELPQEQWPAPLKNGPYTIEWHYDTQSLLLHYGTLLSLAGLERITGIHQKQLWAYMHGRSTPRKAQKDRIQNAVHAFGTELANLYIM